MNEKDSVVVRRLPGVRRLLPTGLLLGMQLSSLPVGAEARRDPDTSGYNLFHPTPRDEMREMSTDRPDQTESPHTVDAGHFQVEMDVVSAVFDRDRTGGSDVQTTGWGTSLNLKAGLLNNVDIQLVLDPYAKVEVKNLETGTKDSASGFGEFQTRLKVNLWGNDGGSTAFAMMPFVKWPLAESGLRNGKTEGGAIFILGYELPAGWGSSVMTEFDYVANETGGYDTEFVNSITFSHDIVGALSGYVEFFSIVTSAGNVDWLGQFDVGFTYAVNDNLQLDTGCNFGVTESAPDFNPFIGLSVRF